MVSRSISLPLSGFFSSFPHGTCSLSVSREYLALEGGPPRFKQNSTCSILLRILIGNKRFWIRDFHPLWSCFPACSPILCFPYFSPTTPNQQANSVWACARSLAATCAISIDFSSYGYLDVSVPHVRSTMATLLTIELPSFQIIRLPHSEITGSKPA
jgi:hypothetical protein